MLAQLLLAEPSPGSGLWWFSAAWLMGTAFWLWTLLDCLTARRVIGREKIVWVVVLLCTYVVGAVWYFLLVRITRAKGVGA